MRFFSAIVIVFSFELLGTACTSKPAASAPAPKVAEEPRVDPVFAPSKSSIDRNGIHETLKGHLKDLRGCYDEALARDANAEGQVSIGFEIDDRGQVTSSEIDPNGTTFRDPVMQRCISDRLKTWSFPKSPRKQTAAVTFPFTFRKGSKP